VAEQHRTRIRLTHHLDRDHTTVGSTQLHPHIVSRDLDPELPSLAKTGSASTRGRTPLVDVSSSADPGIKADWAHLEKIRSPDELTAELDRVRTEYNTVRLPAGIGYVTPDDEHHSHAEAIGQGRRDGLARARQAPIAYRQRKLGNPS
jgi:hypothetical protein